LEAVVSHAESTAFKDPDAPAVDVSVVIAARNEAATIAACVESVRWAREILVVEDGSSDDTANIAHRAGATVINNAFATIGMQRNAAIEKASSDWILVLDADERASPEMASEIRGVLESPRHDAYRVPRRNVFLGREVQHGGWERDRPLRLFRRSIRYNASRVHEHVEVSGSVGEITSSLTHEPYKTLDSWFEKLPRYSAWWAQDRFDKGKRVGIGSVVFRPPLRFLTMFLIRGGFRDGARGALLACMAATSVMAKYARLWTMNRSAANKG
jgi:glycosyltransferase involved in cell wall biosynthesis